MYMFALYRYFIIIIIIIIVFIIITILIKEKATYSSRSAPKCLSDRVYLYTPTFLRSLHPAPAVAVLSLHPNLSEVSSSCPGSRREQQSVEAE